MTSKLFYFYIILISFLKGIGLESNNKIYVIAFAIGCVILVIKLFKEKYKKTELLLMLILLALGMINFIMGGVTKFLLTVITLCGMKNIDIKKVIKYILYTRLITFLFMIAMSSLNIIPMNAIEFYRDGVFIDRMSFGFGHPNTAHNSLAIIIFLILYIYNKKINLSILIVLQVCNYIFYTYTFSRTGFIMITISLILFYLLKKINKINKNIFKLTKITYILLFVFTILVSNLYGKVDLINKINELFTGRIYYNYYLFENFNIPIIGSKMYLQHVIIDNGYVSMLFEGGMLVFLAISILLFKTIDYLKNYKMYNASFLILVFILYSITESNFLSASVNISLLFIGMYLFKNYAKESDCLNEN